MPNLRTRIAQVFRKAAQYLSPVWGYTGSWYTVHETTTGTWQQHVEVNETSVTANWAVFSCVTLIAGDISTMPARVMQYDKSLQIWEPAPEQPKVLRKPNRYQTWIEWVLTYLFSLLLKGNTYVLKERDSSGAVVALYILDPCRVVPLIAEDGGVYYELNQDNLTQIESRVVVPASEIIHDRMYPMFHPLIGVSPLYAIGVAATQGLAIQDNSTKFFENMSRPSGLLTAPGPISNEVAERLKTSWEANYGGENIGKVAVLGDGLKYEAMTITPQDAQMLEQLKFTGEMVCACFHVPPYKLGLGPMPTVNNVAALNQQYYDQALRPLVEKMEYKLSEGLEVRQPNFEIWMDESVLLRMDPSTQITSAVEGIKGGLKKTNEARRQINLPPVEGGDTIWMQEQNFSLAALNKRDQQPDPFGTAQPALPAAQPDDEEERRAEFYSKSLQFLSAELGIAA